MNLTQTIKSIGRLARAVILAGAVIAAILSTHSAFAQSAAQSVSIEVTKTKQQTFQGFGAAIINPLGDFLPSGGRADMPGSTAAALYDLLLAPNSAGSLKLTYLRLDLPTDLFQKSSATPYDFASAVAKTGQEDIIKAAKSRNSKIKLFYNAGTPPFWMKENGADYDPTIGSAANPVTFSTDAATTNHLLANRQTDYANLLGHFCMDFQSHFGYPIDALSLQNEPDVNVNYSCCIYPSTRSVDTQAATYTSMLKTLRQTAPFSSRSLPQIWGPECSGANKDKLDYIADAADLGQLNALCLHSYGNGPGSLPFDYHRNNLPVHMSEYSLYDGDTNNQIGGVVSQPLMAAKMADQFCRDANDGQVASWFWWNTVTSDFTDVNRPANNRQANTGQALIIAHQVPNPNSVYHYFDQGGYPADHSVIALADDSHPVSGKPYESPYLTDFKTDWTLTSRYYAFRRLTQSVLPGSVSLLTKISPSYTQGVHQDDVYSAAFLLPNKKSCIVIANQSGKSYTVHLKVDGLTRAASTGLTAYYTAQGKNDVSWSDALTEGAITTTAWPYSVLCFVQN